MASAAAMAAAHSVPPVYTVPLGPRVRPPRLLPGTKAENTNPQPAGQVPNGKVWVQGRWRAPRSSAAKHIQQTQSRQVEKALNQVTHGMNIYAYRHIRTNQVVYSLTRIMENSKILKQMVFHGKQTVPAALRRDLWRPYFSVHFNQTPAGAQAGLQAYRLLRELALKRQVDPPEGFLIATPEDVEKAKAKYDPANLADMEENRRPELRKLPRVGQVLPMKYRARKLMDQKLSSVADVSFVLGLIEDAKLSPAQLKERCERRLIQKHEARSYRNRRRVDIIRAAQEKKQVQIEERRHLIVSQPGQLRLDQYAAQRIAMEHGGVIAGQDHVKNLQALAAVSAQQDIFDTSVMSSLAAAKPAEFDERQFKRNFLTQWRKEQGNDGEQVTPSAEEIHAAAQEARHAHNEKVGMATYLDRVKQAKDDSRAETETRNIESRNVEIVWADLNDAFHAESWSKNVRHEELDAKAVVKRQVNFVRQEAAVDSEGYAIDEQRAMKLVHASSSPHIIGRVKLEGWYQRPEDLAELIGDETAQKRQQWEQNRRQIAVRNIIAIRSQIAKLSSEVDESSPSARYKAGLEVGENQAALSAQTGNSKSPLEEAQAKLDNIQARYPAYAETLEELDQCSSLIAEVESLNKEARDLASQSHQGVRTSQVIEAEQERDKIRQQLLDQAEDINSEIRQEYDPVFRGFSSLERKRLELEIQLADGSISEADRQRLTDVAADVERLKVDLVLSAHQQRLREEGDPSYELVTEATRTESGNDVSSSATASDPLAQRSADSSANEVVLDKGGVWSRLKGLFGR